MITHWYPLSSQPQVCVVLLSQAPSKGKGGTDIMFKFASQSLKFISYRMQTKHVTEQLDAFFDQETAKILSQLCECNRSTEVSSLGLLWYALYTSTLTCILTCIIPFLKRELLAQDNSKVLPHLLFHARLITFFSFSFTFSFSWYFLSHPSSSISLKHYPASFLSCWIKMLLYPYVPENASTT